MRPDDGRFCVRPARRSLLRASRTTVPGLLRASRTTVGYCVRPPVRRGHEIGRTRIQWADHRIPRLPRGMRKSCRGGSPTASLIDSEARRPCGRGWHPFGLPLTRTRGTSAVQGLLYGQHPGGRGTTLRRVGSGAALTASESVAVRQRRRRPSLRSSRLEGGSAHADRRGVQEWKCPKEDTRKVCMTTYSSLRLVNVSGGMNPRAFSPTRPSGTEGFRFLRARYGAVAARWASNFLIRFPSC